MIDKSQYPLFLIVVKYTQHKIYHFNHFFQNSMVLAQKTEIWINETGEEVQRQTYTPVVT